MQVYIFYFSNWIYRWVNRLSKAKTLIKLILVLKIRCLLKVHEVSRVEPYMYESSKVGYIMILVIYNSIKSKHRVL